MGIRFQPPSKSLTARDYLFIAVVAFVVTFLSMLLVNLNLRFTGGGGDFLVNWVALRSYFVDRVDPYSWEVALRTQRLVYGALGNSGGKPFILDTPFHILLFYYPLVLLPGPVIACAVFMLVLELALLFTSYFNLRLSGREKFDTLGVLLVGFGCFNYYSIHAVLNASPVLLLGMIYVAILYSVYHGADALAGALIAYSLYYWEVGGLFLILVIYRLSQHRRRGVFSGLIMVTIILLAISFLIYPSWIIPFLRASVNDLRADYGFAILKIFNHLWPDHGFYFGLPLILLLLGLVIYEWNKVRESEFRHFFWVSCLTLSASPLIGLRTEMANLSVLVIPALLILSVVNERWGQRRKGIVFIILVLGFMIPWYLAYYIPDRSNRFNQEMLFLFFPIFSIVGLYWIRWWALNPPRTWLDQATSQTHK